MTEQELQKLLRLKRLESPGASYFEGFLAEFHRYQRSALLEEVKAERTFWGWLRMDWNPLGSRLAWGGVGMLIATVLAVIWLVPKEGSEGVVTQWVEATGLGATMAQFFPGELEVKGSAFERDFVSARFVTGEERLMAYDTSVTF